MNAPIVAFLVLLITVLVAAVFAAGCSGDASRDDRAAVESASRSTKEATTSQQADFDSMYAATSLPDRPSVDTAQAAAMSIAREKYPHIPVISWVSPRCCDRPGGRFVGARTLWCPCTRSRSWMEASFGSLSASGRNRIGWLSNTCLWGARDTPGLEAAISQAQPDMRRISAAMLAGGKKTT